MPPLPAVTKVLRHDLRYTIGADSAALTRFFFRYSGGPPTVADFTTMTTALATAFTSFLAPLMSTDYALNAIRLIDLDSATGTELVTTESISGSRSGAQMAAAVCLLENYSIARRYRGGKPRNYFPFGVAGDLGSSDQWGTAFLASANSDIPGYIAAIVSHTFGSITVTQQVNVSYYQGFTTFTTPSGRVKNLSKPRTTPVIDVITATSANLRPGSQRRRNLHSV